MDFLQALANRRSFYHLGKNVNFTQDEISSIIKHCMQYTPSAFNFPTTNLVLAFGKQHEAIWQITIDCLQEKSAKKEDTFNLAKAKVENFKSGFGTILFYEDTAMLEELKETYAMYAENFATWSNQANGMLQANIWTALTDKQIGANLQHYNPLIDDKLKSLFSIPDSFKLTAQMPFGSIETPPHKKTLLDISSRIKIY